jgi:hypothetical protein
MNPDFCRILADGEGKMSECSFLEDQLCYAKEGAMMAEAGG